MKYLDPSLHFSSIAYNGIIDESQPITLEVKGDAIKDGNGNAAKNATYAGIPKLSFYSKHVQSSSGIVIKSDDTVPDSTLRKAAELVDTELGKPGTGKHPSADNTSKGKANTGKLPSTGSFILPFVITMTVLTLAGSGIALIRRHIAR